MTFIANRFEVYNRDIDVLVYLDVGMDPSTTAWAAARIAPIQVCIWGHPSTTGLPFMDYYLSSSLFHLHHNYSYHSYQHIHDNTSDISYIYDNIYHTSTPSNAFEWFSEQLVFFDHLGFYFDRPTLPFLQINNHKDTSTIINPINKDDIGLLDAMINRSYQYYQDILTYLNQQNTKGAIDLIQLIYYKHMNHTSIALIPQHLPKFHPSFDQIILSILIHSPHTIIVIIDPLKKYQWKRILINRWGKGLRRLSSNDRILSINDILERQIMWIHSLTPQEYLILLAIGMLYLITFFLFLLFLLLLSIYLSIGFIV